MQTLKIKKIILPLFLVVLFVVLPFLSFAQTPPAQPNPNLFPCNGPDCQFGHLVKLASGLARELFKYALGFSSIVFAYAGFLYLTSQDDPGKRKTAAKIFQNVAIGLVIMMSAWVIVSLVVTALLSTSITNSPNFPIANPQ